MPADKVGLGYPTHATPVKEDSVMSDIIEVLAILWSHQVFGETQDVPVHVVDGNMKDGSAVTLQYLMYYEYKYITACNTTSEQKIQGHPMHSKDT